MPLGYFLGVIILRQTPNADKLGGIGNSFWHFRDDFKDENKFSEMSVRLACLIGTDVVLLILFLVLAQRVARMSTLRIVGVTLHQHGPFVAAIISFFIQHQFCITSFSCGMDFEFFKEFKWESNFTKVGA